uniref:Peptide hydrolase n=1 Tax=Onygena corvina TaxID=180788 RepID=A0A0B4VM61_9EURO|nr:leucyl aminopeptidase [Onygena corvina]
MKAFAVLALSALAMATPTPSTDMYLIQTGPKETRWVTDAQKLELTLKNVGFFDITRQSKATSEPSQPKTFAFPGSVSHQDEVKPLLEKLSGAHMRSNLEKFSSYPNRYYQSDTGVESAEWLLSQVQAVLANVKGATVEKVQHDFKQPSVRAIIPGKSEKIVIVGAHQDSINIQNRAGSAPGADDNGSGSVTILEGLAALVSNEKIAAGEAENTLEFHWYAGEEAGLLGSQAIFQDYQQMQKPVVAMLNQDMTGYGEKMGVVTDNVDADLTSFTRLVLDAYTYARYEDTECGYACSDHASANKAGFASVMIYEATLGNDNPNIHSPNDTIEKLNFDKMVEHGKLVVGFAYELLFTTF